MKAFEHLSILGHTATTLIFIVNVFGLMCACLCTVLFYWRRYKIKFINQNHAANRIKTQIENWNRQKPLKDISTAPKDREILLWGVYGYTKLKLTCGFVHSKWDADCGDWETPIGCGYGIFTHWCELPNTTGLPVSIQL